jgi:WD40 repeat protein
VATAASIGVTVMAGGYWERGCSSGRGWQALAALPTAQQLAGGSPAAGGSSSLSPGSAGAAGGVLDAAGGAALGGPGWPLAGGQLGYTCMVPVDSSHALVESLLLSGSNGSDGDGSGSSGSSAGVLLAGTADGHVCLLDVETGALLEDCVACWDPRPRAYSSSLGAYARGGQPQVQMQQPGQVSPLLTAAGGPAGWDGLPAAADPSSCVVSAVCYSSRGCGGAVGGWVGAGSGSGRVTVLDMRAGVVAATWQAHGQRVSQLQGLSGAQGDHLLLSCSADKTMKLWDLRMTPQAGGPHASLAAFGSSGGGYGSSGLAAPLTTYRSGRDGIDGFVVYQDAAIVYGGGSVGLAPLELPMHAGGAAAAGLSGALTGPLQHQQQGSSVQVVRMTAVKGLGYRGGGVREGLGAAGTGAVIGLGVLPYSKLLVVGTEDGLLRICR